MAPRGGVAGSGNNLVLASGLALLSYVPFEYVAKGSLIVCAILFILDPIPPLSRLLALLSLLVVHFLSKLHRQAVVAKAQQAEITIVEHYSPSNESASNQTEEGDSKSKHD